MIVTKSTLSGLSAINLGLPNPEAYSSIRNPWGTLSLSTEDSAVIGMK